MNRILLITIGLLIFIIGVSCASAADLVIDDCADPCLEDPIIIDGNVTVVNATFSENTTSDDVSVDNCSLNPSSSDDDSDYAVDNVNLSYDNDLIDSALPVCDAKIVDDSIYNSVGSSSEDLDDGALQANGMISFIPTSISSFVVEEPKNDDTPESPKKDGFKKYLNIYAEVFILLFPW